MRAARVHSKAKANAEFAEKDAKDAEKAIGNGQWAMAEARANRSLLSILCSLVAPPSSSANSVHPSANSAFSWNRTNAECAEKDAEDAE